MRGNIAKCLSESSFSKNHILCVMNALETEACEATVDPEKTRRKELEANQLRTA